MARYGYAKRTQGPRRSRLRGNDRPRLLRHPRLLPVSQTDHAFVRANTVGIAPQLSGPIVELAIRDNQHVRRGDLLFIVGPSPSQEMQ